MDKNHLAKIIHFHRKKSGLSQEALGHLAGLGKTVIFDIEKGKMTIRLDTLLKVLNVLNIKIEFQSPLIGLGELKSPLIDELKGLVKKAKVFVDGVLAGELHEIEREKKYRFIYLQDYKGLPVSLNMPTHQSVYEYDKFPPFFEGLLPEGMMLEALLKQAKIDRDDLMSQLIKVGGDLVGNVTVEGIKI